MDIKRINELKKVQEKQDTIEETLYKLKTSSKAVALRVEFEPDSYEFYGSDRDGLEFEPCKQGLIIYLEHEVKHCEIVKAEIVKEFALEILPKLDTPELAYIETKAEMDVAIVKGEVVREMADEILPKKVEMSSMYGNFGEVVEQDKLIEFKQHMESGENQLSFLPVNDNTLLKMKEHTDSRGNRVTEYHYDPID